jgi:hypothetical protein
MDLLDLTGRRYGKLVAVKRDGTSQSKRATWLCRCDCGVHKVIRSNDLRTGRTQSCGCLKRANVRERNKAKIIDLIDQRFGKLVVVKYAGSIDEHAIWLCRCDCGSFKVISAQTLRRKPGTKSCGCLRKKT